MTPSRVAAAAVGEWVRLRSGTPALAPRELRESEVEDLHDAVRRDHDVRGLQIAMDDAAFVRGFERGGDLSRDAEGFLGNAERS